MNKINYNKKMEEIIKSLAGKKAKLLLHSCCAPCSSYVLEYLSSSFDITLYYYNQNIHPESEYIRRFNELKDFTGEVYKGKIEIISETYNPMEFFDTIHNYEDKAEGGSRCSLCYHMRLKKAAERAKEGGFDYFGSVLTISPHKNADRINLIGANLEKIYNIKFLYSDFKKNNGFKRSLEISKEHDLYRQQYCGCSFSMRNQAECL